MATADVRRQFEAYAAGKISEATLREGIRRAMLADPTMAAAFAALTSALEHGRQINSELAGAIRSDIGEDAGRTTFSPQAARALPQMSAITDAPVILPNAFYAGTATDPGIRGPTTGSAWDTPERMAEPAMPLSIGARLNNRYELMEELGRGGMGVVYKALDRTIGELKDRRPYVAIKLLNEEFKRHPLAVQSLQREARKAQKLAHPNIVTVHDFDRDGGNVYMVMELLTGHSLEQLLHHEGSAGLPLKRVLDIVQALGAALSYAHAQGIVHADFKPSNAFVTDAGAIKVLDFGVARAAHSLNAPSEKTLFDAGQLGAISPPYASLEMLTGGTPDPRDDLYALACVTYELLTGRHPFKRIDAVKARDAGLLPPPIKKLSRDQWQALRQALAFKREARTGSVDMFLKQFSQRRKSRAWWPAVAAVVALAGVMVFLVPRQWQAHESAVLAEALQSTDYKTYADALERLKSVPAALRARTLADDAVRQSIVDHYRKAIAQAAGMPNYEIARARSLLAELRKLLPDSRAVTGMAESLDQSAKLTLTQQLQAREQALLGGILLPRQGPDDLATVLERIRHIDPTQPTLNDPRNELAYVAAAQAASAAGQLDLAKALANAGLGLAAHDVLPPRAEVEARNVISPDTQALRGELSRLLVAPEATGTWGDSLRAALQALSASLPADDALLVDARRAGVATFVKAANEARDQQRFPEASSLLVLAREIDPQSPELARASEDLANAQSASTAAAAGREQPAGIDSLKQKLTAQLVAGDMDGANVTASTLRRALAGSTYVSKELPTALIAGYVHLARTQLGAGHVDGALQTLAAGRRKFGASAELKALELRYVTIGDAYDRLRTAVVLNVGEQRHYLEQLAATEGSDYPAIERMLVNTLANRIADQKAANRASLAASLLQAGGRVFPAYAALLEQGTPGALPQSGLEVVEQ